MLSKTEIDAKIQEVERESGTTSVPEYTEGKREAFDQIHEDPNPETCIEIIEQAEQWSDFWYQMSLSPMAGLAGFGEVIAMKSAYYDGMVMIALDVLEGSIEYENDRSFVNYNNQTVEV